MTRRFSVRPALTVRGRKWKGLRGWAGKPFHPPLTDVPVVAYLFAAVFDVLSRLLSEGHGALPTELYRAATWCLLGGALVSPLASLTGWADWHRSSQVGTQARRTINTHAVVMIATTVVVAVDLVYRLGSERAATVAPALAVLLSVLAALLVTVGSTYGGTLVFDYGFNVETAGDSPVWHVSEVDVYPGRK